MAFSSMKLGLFSKLTNIVIIYIYIYIYYILSRQLLINLCINLHLKTRAEVAVNACRINELEYSTRLPLTLITCSKRLFMLYVTSFVVSLKLQNIFYNKKLSAVNTLRYSREPS